MGVFPFAKALSENNPTSAVCAQIEPEHFLILIGFARGGGVSRVSVDYAVLCNKKDRGKDKHGLFCTR